MTNSLAVLDDLRGKWTTRADAYRWAFDHLWPRLNHHVIACVWPNILEPRDYLVENKVFTFFISGPNDRGPAGSSAAEVELMERLLAKMPVNIPVMGYPQPFRLWAHVALSNNAFRAATAIAFLAMLDTPGRAWDSVALSLPDVVTTTL